MKPSLIERVIEPGAITPVFQPIVDIRQSRAVLHGVEGLSRGPRGSTLEAPDVLFEFARRKHEESIVDRAAIAAILASADRLPNQIPVHLNVHASTIGRDASFASYLQRLGSSAGLTPDRIVVEILEHSNFVEEKQYLAGIERLRDVGIRIALDDVGVGASNFRMILLTRPEQLKIDRCLVDGVAGDPYKQATLRAIRIFADQVGAAIVAEGIEQEADLVALRALGVELGQGYLFSWPRLIDELLEVLPRAPFALAACELAAAC